MSTRNDYTVTLVVAGEECAVTMRSEMDKHEAMRRAVARVVSERGQHVDVRVVSCAMDDVRGITGRSQEEQGNG